MLPRKAVPVHMAHILCVASCFLSLTKLSIGQREVRVQEGPLYRAEGYPISIGCNVSGHQGPSEQDFQWSVYLPTAPQKELQIISTKDAHFSYAVYATRVRSKEIYIERLQGNSVLLRISNLQMRDSGEYECHTPNTDEKYFGSYSAKTTLTVIPDTLSAAMRSQTFSKEEGESLELTCEASKATAQHTHLSLTWYLLRKGGSQAVKIISLSKDFMLTPGPAYADRFSAGDVRLDKLGVASFRLSIDRLQPSDEGQLFCEATEWIQDPDKTWTLITRKQTDQTTLRVQPAVRDFEVSITAKSPSAEGKPLELVCLVVGRSGNLQLQAVWFLNGMEIAQIDAGGVLDLKRNYGDRSIQGQLQVSKLSPQAFSLKIFSMRPEDIGGYSCAVAEVMRTRTGSWQMLQKKQSPVSQVQPREPAARSVAVSSEHGSLWEGEAIRLLCRAGGAASSLSVSWWHIPQDQSSAVLVANMGQDGTVQLGASSMGPRYQSNTRLEKVDWATFRLEITSAMVTDSGAYECRVSERPQNQGRDLQWTQKISVTVKSLKSSLQVNLMSRRQPQVKLTDTLDLSCLVVGGNFSELRLPFSVTWQFQPASSGVFHQLIRITHNGTIEWGNFLSQFHGKTKVSQSSFRSQLRIHDATEEEMGLYQCKVEVYDRSSLCTSGLARASATSNPLRITVTLPESKLGVNADNQVQVLSIGSNTRMECGISSRSTGSLPLSIIWYFSPISTNASYLKILEMDQTNVIQYGEEFQTPRSKQKFHSEKVSQDLFLLHILNVEDSDQGQYHCTVEEWLFSTNGAWKMLGRKSSGLTELKLKPTGSKVHVSKLSWSENATEHGEAGFNCSLSGSSSSAALYSVTWYWSRPNAASQMLVQLQYDGLLEYGDDGRRRRLQCYRSSATDFILKLHLIEMEDAGMYWCRVAEWQQHSHQGKWISQASDESQRMALRVLPSELTLSSRICSSALLVHFFLVCPFLVLFLLLIPLLHLYWKTRKLSQLSLSTQKEKALWVGMKGTTRSWNIVSREAGEEDEGC